MLLFASPLWLWALPPVAAAGAAALWRARHRPRPVSSLRLWQDLPGHAPAPRRRLIDPPWLFVFLAALLATAALARPAWQTPTPPPSPHATMQWSVRSLHPHDAPAITEAWAHLLSTTNLPTALVLQIQTDSGDQQLSLPTSALAAGTTLPLPATATRATFTLEPSAPPTPPSASTTSPLARATFLRPAIEQPFALLGAACADPALARVFSIEPEARPDDPTLSAAILLLSAPSNPPVNVTTLPGPTLIIAQPSVPLPGLTPGETVSLSTPLTPIPAPQQPAAAALPAFVHLDHVHVTAYRAVTLSSPWQVLATISGNPWLATMHEKQSTFLWLASLPSTDTDWPKDPAFVLFFTDLAHQALARTGVPAASWADWQPLEIPSPPPLSASRAVSPKYPLTPWLGIASILLLLTATALLSRRTPRPPPLFPHNRTK